MTVCKRGAGVAAIFFLIGSAGMASAAQMDACEQLHDLVAQIDTALTQSEAGQPVDQMSMLRLKLAVSKTKLGLSEAGDSWPDPRTGDAALAVSAAAKGPDGGKFDSGFATEILLREGPILAEGLAQGCPDAELPARFDTNE